jgi:lipopolysaccharide export system protein LptA
MPVSIPRLRIWFAVLALAAVAVVGGVYLRARMELRKALRDLPGKVGIDIQQTSEGFTMSKSEGGRTLFTIHASKATQFKAGGHATLHNVNILVYGKQSDRFDQISGDDFDYDQQAGTVVSKGLVHIDLQDSDGGKPGANAGSHPAASAPITAESKNAIHLRAEGMTFDQKSGLADSEGRVDFQVPQAAGTAHGATYDSKNNQLTLHAAVDITTDGKQPTHILAHSGMITKEPRVITMKGAEMTGQGRTVLADNAIVHLAENSEVQRVDASGNVRLSDAGGMQLHAPKGELTLGAQNMVESALFTGGVDFESAKQGTAGHSGEMRMHFAAERAAQPIARKAKPKAGGSAKAHLQTIFASGGTVLRQAPRPGSAHPQSMTMTSDAMTFAMNGQQQLTSAETAGPGELTTRSADPKQAGDTVIDAQHFTADFGAENHLQTLHGTGAVKVTSRAPGAPDKVSTSDTLVADFSPAGEITRAVQEGTFHYKEAQSSKDELGGRRAWAQRATYSPLDESMTLTGDPRVIDGGTTVVADSIRLLRTSGELFATGNVKTTYSELTQQPSGALLANSDPVHVTAKAMNALQSSGLAHYTGGSRLWQGSNIVEAPAIDFEQKTRTIVAQGDVKRPVSSWFTQVDAKGKSSTMLVTAPKLNYSDNDRQAHYSGGVTAKSEDGVMTAGKADVFLNPAGAKTAMAGPSQLDHIIATTHVLVQQQERRAEGEKLVYQASTGTYVMTGGSPMLSDPVNGTVRGDSLTFYNRDDRVVVEGSDSTRAVTHTHVSR